MHPAVARPGHPSLQPPSSPVTSTATLLHQHPRQQGQQIVYGPVTNSMVTLQPCGPGLHPSCVYPGVQRNSAPPNALPLHAQGRNNKWSSKHKVPRNQQQQQQQQHIPQQLPYTPKPLLLFDQTTTSAPPPLPASATSFLIASSTFTHGSFPGDQYSGPGVTLVPQSYFKPAPGPTFCLQTGQQHHQEQAPHGSYYNVSATSACNLQPANPNSTFQLSNLGPYTATFACNNISGPVYTLQSGQILSNNSASPTVANTQREKPSSLWGDAKSLTYNLPDAAAQEVNVPVSSESFNEWTSPATGSSQSNLANTPRERASSQAVEPTIQKADSNAATGTQEEHYSDESSASFDFTIEAEKMVSALCNTTSSNDLAKEAPRENNKIDSGPLFSGAGDTASNKNAWFPDFCADYGASKSIAVQTDESCIDGSYYPELMRKAVYWGCTEAEIFLNKRSNTDSRCDWLRSLSSATKTAITKSSTCFPIFAGDRAFVNDLISSVLRISNGWLVLDNYLNKQHYPGLDDKFDRKLVNSFKTWEKDTYELLDQIVPTFTNIEKNMEPDSEQKTTETSFPGDVSLYTSCDLFQPSARLQDSVNDSNGQGFGTVQLTCSQFSIGSVQQRQQTTQKETKLRSKWTVTENLTVPRDSTKSVPDMFLGQAETDVQVSGRYRKKVASPSSIRFDTSTQSLNAEFFHLKSKVLQSNQESSRSCPLKDKKQEAAENRGPSLMENMDSIYGYQRSVVDANCQNTFTQRPAIHVDAAYPNAVNFCPTVIDPNYIYAPYPMTDHSSKYLKNPDQFCSNRTSTVDPVYIGKSSKSQLELTAVPRNKMTLLSQIEPKISSASSGEITANLSAWFASMRNCDRQQQLPISSVGEPRSPESGITWLPYRPKLSRNTVDLTKQLQIDASRQLQTLQSIPNIQGTGWNAGNLFNNRVGLQQMPEEYDSSEDVRIYMKPGSYNVPKKRQQRKSGRRMDSSSRNTSVHRSHYQNKDKAFASSHAAPVSQASASAVCAAGNNNTSLSIKFPFPPTPIVPPPNISLEKSPKILRHVESAARGTTGDVAWKAACASAEILLEALNVKENSGVSSYPSTADRGEDNECIEKDDTNNGDGTLEATEDQRKWDESVCKIVQREEDDCPDASSYEASGDDSESPYRLSPNSSFAEIFQPVNNKNGVGKNNVKTDSWLISTLNNAGIGGKQKRRKNNLNQHTSESSNSSALEDELTTRSNPVLSIDVATTVAAATTIEQFQQSHREIVSASMQDREYPNVEETECVVGKATYSETVRRCAPISASEVDRKESSKRSKVNSSYSTACCTIVPVPGRKCQRKDSDRSRHLLQKSRRSSGRKIGKNTGSNECQVEESLYAKTRISRVGATKESSFINPYVASKAMGKVHGKKRTSDGCGEVSDAGKCGGKSSGWSVWYSTKRKQGLSPLMLSKLELIHQTVWQMEEADVFKHTPACVNASVSNQSLFEDTVQDCYRISKSPIFLETVGYKLKHRVYHKVEHVIRDFRRMVHNSRLCHKNDQDRVKTIEILSKKVEELFEEHFASWEFDSVSAGLRAMSPISRCSQSVAQKPVAGRHSATKKSPSPSVVAENETTG